MPEWVGSYSIPTANGNMEGADTLVGARILNFKNIYVQKTLINALIVPLIILSFGVKFPQLYDSYPNCQFAGLTYTGQCYWYHVVLRP